MTRYALVPMRARLNSGLTSAPRWPQVPIVTNKYAAGLEMLCPGGALLKLGPKIPQHRYV
jgi:hypothetical protein